MKMVIYNTVGGWEVTTLENFRAGIRDARLVHFFPYKEWDSDTAIINYFCKYCGTRPDDFTHPHTGKGVTA